MPTKLVPNFTHMARQINMRPVFVWIRVTSDIQAANDAKGVK